MFVPLFSVGLGLALVAANAQDEKDGVPYPGGETSAEVSALVTSSSLSTPDGYPDCFVRYAYWVGDGWCDTLENYNTEACGYDGGDCCECTCTDAKFECDVWTPFYCLDHDADCPSNCMTGIVGYLGWSPAGEVCCPVGCSSCGDDDECSTVGAADGLGHADCCINGVLHNQDYCDVAGAAPCVRSVRECIDGIDGLLGENDNGSVCCPVGCGQCGDAGCGSAGAANGFDNTACCINGVLNNQELCSVSGAAPCIVDPPCSDGTVGIEGSNANGAVCCPLGCTQCGGAGCATAGSAAGLSNKECCINGVLNNQDYCFDSVAAPCILSFAGQ